MRLALYQPDIPQNVGAAIRAAACFSAAVDIIAPCGFPLDSREIKRVAMDYGLIAPVVSHAGWSAFRNAPERAEGRLVLLTTKGDLPLWEYNFKPGDTLLMGRESAGVPEEVRESAEARLVIPIAPNARSLNIAVAAAIALAEARRRIGWDDEGY